MTDFYDECRVCVFVVYCTSPCDVDAADDGDGSDPWERDEC